MRLETDLRISVNAFPAYMFIKRIPSVPHERKKLELLEPCTVNAAYDMPKCMTKPQHLTCWE